MSNAEDKERNRFYLIAGGLIVGAILVASAFFMIPKPEEEVKTPSFSEEQLASAVLYTSDVLTLAGNFGLSEAAVQGEGFDAVTSLLARNNGEYSSETFGLSRGQLFGYLQEAVLDPRGPFPQDLTTVDRIKGYTPDWSGQLVRYQLSNVQVTPGEALYVDEIPVLNLQASFTVQIDLWVSQADFGSTERKWTHYNTESFETLNLQLSYQRDTSTGEWKLWDIDDLEDHPYALVTWKNPDWHTAVPSPRAMNPAQD